MNDGSMSLWDPKLILSEYKQQKDEEEPEVNLGCLALYCYTESAIPINDVQFNPHKPNLLASGGEQVLIHNLEKNIEDPEVVLPGENSPHGTSIITSVAWN